MDENKFWVTTWAILASTFVLSMCLVIYSDIKTDEKIVESIKAGANPINSMCAFNFSTEKAQICALAAQK